MARDQDKAADRNYDLILIGSGMGALTVGSLMAQLRGKRVLILERHFRVGGFTHAFRRGRFTWDVGVHYIGQVEEGSRMGSLFRLITGGEAKWSQMPDPFDVFDYPDLKFEHHCGEERFIEDLSALFPAEKDSIRRYVRDVHRAAAGFGMYTMSRSGSGLIRAFARAGGLFRSPNLEQTTKDYLDQNIKDSRLKAVLASQWGDYGLPPSLSPFALHALIVRHYMDGAYYPVGGAGTWAAGAARAVEAAGGRVLCSREVREILLDGNRAIGVLVRNGRGEEEEYQAPVVVSNAGAAATYLRLLPDSCPIPFGDSLREFVQGRTPTSHVSLYVGFKDDPRQLGFRGENHWLFRRFRHDKTYDRRSTWITEGGPDEIYLSFPSLKDPEADGHTAELVSFSDYAPFERWRDQPWRNRDAGYQALKERISDGLLAFVEERHPGFTNLVEYKELSTPLTNEFMTGHYRGGIYGLPSVAERFRPENLGWTHARTPVDGLYQTGADVGALGIFGAMMGGLTTLSHLPGGISFPQAFRAASSAS